MDQLFIFKDGLAYEGSCPNSNVSQEEQISFLEALEMKMIRLFSVVSLMLLAASVSSAQSFQRAGLQGVNAMKVVIEDLLPETADTGLTVEQLRADVELRLRKSGIRVVDESDAAAPWLYLQLPAFKNKQFNFYAASVSLEFRRLGTFGTGKEQVSVLASVWSNSMLTVQPSRDFRTTARDIVAQIVDMFINDYLAANPK
jgi:hypothetical protein